MKQHLADILQVLGGVALVVAGFAVGAVAGLVLLAAVLIVGGVVMERR